MKILYIHGLGSGKYSETPKRLQKALPEAEVISPEIPIDPAEAQRFLEENFLNDTSIDLVVGSSLGGFYSLLLKHHRKLLVNPALFADEDIEKCIGLGEQDFLSPRENGETSYMIDDRFIHSLAMIRKKIFRGYPRQLGKTTQEQMRNTWAIFADKDELLHHYEDFCHLFRPDHAFRMKGEHRVSEENIREDLIPLIRNILAGAEKQNMEEKMRKESDHEVLRERKSEETEEISRLRREVMRRTGRPWLDDDLPLPDLFRGFIKRYYTGEDESPRSLLKRIIDESKKKKARKKHYREPDEEQMDPYRNWSPYRYNSWPFGEQSDEIWPDCIVACVGPTRLFTALEKVKYYSEEMARKYAGNSCEKNVIVITDKWTPDAFDKFELELLRHAVYDEINYYFILVTEYGFRLVLSLRR